MVAIQVIYSKDRTKIAQIEHMPVETLRAEKCNEKGDIEAYYYWKDWSKIRTFRQTFKNTCIWFKQRIYRNTLCKTIQIRILLL